MEQEQDKMYLVEAKIENFKKLSMVELRPTPEGVIEVVGDNAQGKTSVIDALESVFSGSRGDPAEPIRQGEKRAAITVKLGPDPVTIEKSWKRGGNPKLEIKLADGSSPKGGAVNWLKSVSLPANFDPARCIDDEKATRAALLKIAGLKPDWDSFPGGRPFDADAPDADPLVVIQTESMKLDNKRLEAQREKKRLEQVKNTLDAEVPADKRSLKPADLNGLLKERDAIQAEHRAWDEHQREIETAESYIEKKKAEIAEIKKRLSVAVQDLENKEEELEKILAEQPKTPRNVADVDAKIAGIQDHNRLAAKAETLRQVEKDWKAAWVTEDDCADMLADIKTFTDEVLAGANLPVEGLALTAETVTLHGIPLAQASLSERARIAYAVLHHLNPRLRLVCLDDAEKFGKGATADIYRMSKEFDFLTVMCRVGEDSSNPDAIILEDGGAI